VTERGLATAVFLALRTGRPLFLEGEAGVGKTEIAKVLAQTLGRRALERRRPVCSPRAQPKRSPHLLWRKSAVTGKPIGEMRFKRNAFGRAEDGLQMTLALIRAKRSANPIALCSKPTQAA
jgi:hypothetical protein